MKKTLTHALVEGLKAPAAGQIDIWDTKIAGFGVRVSQGGSKTWLVRYRQGGRRARYVLGRFPQMSLADARQAARLYLGDVAGGKDPAAERAEAKGEMTFRQLSDTYIVRHAVNKRPGSRREDEKILRHDLLPAWGDWKVSSIERRHIIEVLDAIIDRGAPIQANRTKSLICTIFRFGEDRQLLRYNPAVRLKSPAPEQARDRVLSEDEIHRLFEALEAESPRRQAIVRMALLTAARRGEILGMGWAEIDGDVWTLPAARVKNKHEHRLPLVPSVLAAIEALPHDGPFVFHSHRPVGQSAMQLWDWFPALCARAGIEGATFHDLRRTAATWLNKIGVAPVIVERVLNHVQGGVAAIYNRHSYDLEKRAALLKWERRLNEIVEGAPASAKVVNIRGGSSQ